MTINPTARNRLTPVSATTRELYLYSGNRCAFTGCAKPLLKENGSWNCEVAHIYGVKPKSARGNHALSDEQLRETSNLLLLCREHHKDIDNKLLEDTYSVEVVRKMKSDHESRYRGAMAGLERIVDTSAGYAPQYPVDLFAIDGFKGLEDDDELIVESLADMRRFIQKLAEQPAGVRDLILLILVHGRQRRGLSASATPPIAVPVTQIEGVAQLDEHEIKRRARHLEDAGLLNIVDDEGFYFFSLTDPIQRNVGWDIFVEIKELAKGNRNIIERAVSELDFTVFEG